MTNQRSAPRGLLLLAACFSLSLSGCQLTAAQKTTVDMSGTVIADVGSAVPLVCSLIPGSSATACGQDAGIVSKVASLVASILAALPSARLAAPVPGPPAGLVWRGVAVGGLSASDAAAVRRGLEGMPGAAVGAP